MQEHYGFARDGEIIIAPAFNILCGGLPLNEPVEEMRGPLLAMADWEKARLYLQDGTNLGILTKIKSVQRKPVKAARTITTSRDANLTIEGDKE